MCLDGGRDVISPSPERIDRVATGGYRLSL